VSGTTAEQSHASPAQDSETLKALEIVNLRLAAAHETIKLLNDRLTEKDAIADALRSNIAVKDEMISLLKSANQDRTTVNTGDARILEACNQQLTKAEARIWKLEHPGLLRSIFDPRSLTGFGAGYGARSVQEMFKR
jgi:uncharacterized coiled-coil protein SlyX